MTKLLYCATCPEGMCGSPEPAELTEVFEFSQRHPTVWNEDLGQFEVNPHYVKNAFLEWSPDHAAILLAELGLEGHDKTGDGVAWALGDIQARITAWQSSARLEEPDGIDTSLHDLIHLVDRGARQGATHLVMA